VTNVHARGTRPWHPIERGLGVFAGAGFIVGFFCRPTGHGLGSTMSGARLADLILRRPMGVPKAFGVALYAVAFGGVLLASLCVLGGHRARIIVIAATATAAIGLAAIVWGLRGRSATIGPGVVVAGVPAILFLLAEVTFVRVVSRDKG
jgi:hypothetical protein